MTEESDDQISGFSRAAARADKRFARHERENRFLVKRSEDFQVMDDVFDKPTLLAIKDLINAGILISMESHFASGKESKVYLALAADGIPVAVKIFLTVSTEFKKRMQYIAGDPRFEGIKKGSTRNLISAWAKKEFRNLQVAKKSGASVPAPISIKKNVLVMELVRNGSDGPAPLLANCDVTSEDYSFILQQIRVLYGRAGLVHADLSEYNVMKPNAAQLVLFDFGSAVSVRHPNSKQFLIRDIVNVNKFFEKRGIETIDISTAQQIIKGEATD